VPDLLKACGMGPRGRYYNPPSVLVLELPQDLPGTARVAPVYDDLRLAGPGDVPLKNGLFAESWNTFPVNVEDLEYCGYSVERERVDEVLLTLAAPWTDLEQGSHLEAFRRLEVERPHFLLSKPLTTSWTLGCRPHQRADHPLPDSAL